MQYLHYCDDYYYNINYLDG